MAPQGVTRWQYVEVTVGLGTPYPDRQAMLHKLGTEGWELVSVVYVPHEPAGVPLLYVFKQPQALLAPAEA